MVIVAIIIQVWDSLIWAGRRYCYNCYLSGVVATLIEISFKCECHGCVDDYFRCYAVLLSVVMMELTTPSRPPRTSSIGTLFLSFSLFLSIHRLVLLLLSLFSLSYVIAHLVMLP